MTDLAEVDAPVAITMMVTWTDPAAIELLEAAIANAGHLKPLWERIRVREEPDGRALVGVPVSNKVTQETCDNHARHFYSLLNLLGVPLVPSPMSLQRLDVADAATVRPLHFEDPKAAAKAAKAAEKVAKAEAAAAAAALAAAAAAPTE